MEIETARLFFAKSLSRPIYLSIFLPFFLYIYPSVQFYTYQSIYPSLSVYISIHRLPRFIHLSICLPIQFLHIYPSLSIYTIPRCIHPSIYLSFYVLSIHTSPTYVSIFIVPRYIHLSSICHDLFIYLSFFLSIYLSIYLSI